MLHLEYSFKTTNDRKRYKKSAESKEVNLLKIIDDFMWNEMKWLDSCVFLPLKRLEGVFRDFRL